VELLERVGEHVVVAAWLAAELPAPRFGARVREALLIRRSFPSCRGPG
jgi:hypothetical protein